MRELMLENVGGKWSPSQEASCMVLADNDLTCVRHRFPDRCERGKCKDRARLKGSRETGVGSSGAKRRQPRVKRRSF